MPAWFHRAFTFLRRSWGMPAVALCLVLGLPGATLRWWPLPPWPPLAPQVEAPDGTLLGAALSADGQWRLPTRLEQLSPDLVATLLEKEDRWFYHHPGVNPLAIGRAALQNLSSGRRVSGASTLTMQLARLLEPGARTLPKKGLEALRALQLEWVYSKAELLTRYATLAPCGGNVQGFAAASRRYFGRAPSALSLAQSVTLVLLPGRPTALRPGRADAELRRARDAWLSRLERRGRITATDAAAARAEDLGLGLHPLPRRAPHLARRLLSTYPADARIVSTIRPAVQQQAQQALAAYVARLRNYQVTNAAALVVHTPTRQVWAYVGAADFDDAAALGQVDGIQAVRSPGSALKPLVYALALERGLVTPRTIIADVPTRFAGGYSPENYDLSFSGRVTVRQALERSLNVPAVRLLEQVGVQAFTGTLARAGFATVAAQADQLGLSVALGGCGVRLSELVGLYATLADGGQWRPLVYTLPFEESDLSESNGDSTAHALVSPAAAWLTADILTTLTRPDLPNNLDNATHLPKLAWKTGTSYGRRDAWAVGFTGEFTVGVWVGNFDGRGAPALSGADVATPLLFQLVQALPGVSRARWLTRPPEVLPRAVCSLTGALPDTFCHDLVTDDYIQGRAPAQRCRHLAPHWVSPDGRWRYTPDCAPPTATRRLYLNPPAELVAWARTQGGAHAALVPQLPPLAPGCTTAERGAGPEFELPLDGADYYFGRTQPRRLVLRVAAPAGVARLHWFAQGRYLGASPPDSGYVYEADTGRIALSVTDDRGRSRHIRIRVLSY